MNILTILRRIKRKYGGNTDVPGKKAGTPSVRRDARFLQFLAAGTEKYPYF